MKSKFLPHLSCSKLKEAMQDKFLSNVENSVAVLILRCTSKGRQFKNANKIAVPISRSEVRKLRHSVYCISTSMYGKELQIFNSEFWNLRVFACYRTGVKRV